MLEYWTFLATFDLKVSTWVSTLPNHFFSFFESSINRTEGGSQKLEIRFFHELLSWICWGNGNDKINRKVLRVKRMKCSSTGKEWYCLSNLDTDKLHLKDPNADTAIVDKDIDTMYWKKANFANCQRFQIFIHLHLWKCYLLHIYKDV